jgi:hypothetical protein
MGPPREPLSASRPARDTSGSRVIIAGMAEARREVTADVGVSSL